MLSLERIDLRDNQMTDPAEIARLTGLPNITDIYVNKNPFTRTHADYRLLIFNLFRKTPGYMDDVFLDGGQPSYSEKKYLVDRAPELPNVPVIKPEPEIHFEMPIRERPEPIIEDFVDPFYERRRSQELLRQRRKSDFGVSSSQRRKKTARRRVVELSESDFNAEAEAARRTSAEMMPPPAQPKNSLTDDSTYGGSEAETTPGRTTREREPSETLTIKATPPPSHPPPIESDVSPSLLRTGTDSVVLGQQQFSADSEVYRQRIQALRNDFGNGWLAALSDETWDNTAPIAFTSPSLAPVRTPSQSIVAGSRTLG